MRRVLVRFGGILVLAMIAIWLYCLLDAATADRERVRALPKGAWVAVVLVTFIAGAVAWLLLGRPRGPERAPRLGSSRRTSWPARPPTHPSSGPASGAFRRPGPVAPDDDPEFLARLDREVARDHEKLLGSWEEDLRKREEELRRREDGDPGPDEPGDPRR